MKNRPLSKFQRCATHGTRPNLILGERKVMEAHLLTPMRKLLALRSNLFPLSFSRPKWKQIISSPRSLCGPRAKWLIIAPSRISSLCTQANFNSGEAAAKRKTNECCGLLKPHGTELSPRPLQLPMSPLKNSDFFSDGVLPALLPRAKQFSSFSPGGRICPQTEGGIECHRCGLRNHRRCCCCCSVASGTVR